MDSGPQGILYLLRSEYKKLQHKVVVAPLVEVTHAAVLVVATGIEENVDRGEGDIGKVEERQTYGELEEGAISRKTRSWEAKGRS